jgi:hypothetical protein
MSSHPAPELAYEARLNRGSRRAARNVRQGMWPVTGLPMCAAVLAVAGGVTGLPPASANGGCIPGDIPGEVPRLTRPSDNVCVPPNIAQEVQSENAAAAQGQGYAGGGAYGPKTCTSGLVWREGYDGDAVCVSPQRRQETWQENANAGVGATGGLQPQTNPPGPGRHTVTYQVLGPGDVFSVIPDPGTSVYPPSTTKWVATPWSQTVEVTGSKYLALNYTDHNGTHDCAIQVDGKPVALTEHKPGRCAYQLP